MKRAICTTSTASHLYKVDALFARLIELGETADLVCWCVDSDSASLKHGTLVTPRVMLSEPRIASVFNRHKGNYDRIRWSLKPILLQKLLGNYDKAIYIDNDIFFFSPPEFLWKDLDRYDVLLTPHHYPRNPKEDQNWLEANYKVGLYNAGFIGVNTNANHIMDWWADCCLYRCEKSLIRGLFDDQKYLDLVPIMHPNTKILEHKGCNVAGWNVKVCTRVEQPDGTVLIDNKWPLVFLHFNGFSVRSIIQDQDPLLKPSLDKYVQALQVFRPELELDELWRENTLWDRMKLSAWRLLDRFNK